MNGPSGDDQAALAARYPNPVLGRINAAFFSFMDGYMHWKYAAKKSALFGNLPNVIVELGAGTGANFRYFRRGTKVIAVEPNVYMHAALRRAAERYRLELDIRVAGAERIDLPSESVDAVVASLVLCTVDDQRAAIAEARRILRPGGRLVCIEHVAAPERSLVGWLQRLVFHPWRWFFEGCHTHRDTERALRAGGFSRVDVEHFTLPSAFVPVRPQIAATCAR